ncbi:MAG: hypothetical protein M1298_02185 [Chloroflexi bacterium]|nr:hypothetical protein [Chloroflexota bacterium]
MHSGFLRGILYIALWALLVAWCIGAPVVGILIASFLLAHPAQRIFIPLSLIVTIWITIKGAQLLQRLGDYALGG